MSEWRVMVAVGEGGWLEYPFQEPAGDVDWLGQCCWFTGQLYQLCCLLCVPILQPPPPVNSSTLGTALVSHQHKISYLPEEVFNLLIEFHTLRTFLGQPPSKPSLHTIVTPFTLCRLFNLATNLTSMVAFPWLFSTQATWPKLVQQYHAL